ncbi:MAG: hypothetical protein VW378_02475 [bacterium]
MTEALSKALNMAHQGYRTPSLSTRDSSPHFDRVLHTKVQASHRQSVSQGYPPTPNDIQGLVLTASGIAARDTSAFSDVQAFFLAKQRLGDQAVIQLSLQLQQTPNTLQHLILGHNGITPFAAAALADLLKVNHFIGWLVLNGNKLSDLGAQKLATGLAKNKGLIHLILDDNDISDLGVSELSTSLKEHPTLESLFLKNNALTDRSKDALVSLLLHSHSLKRLDLRGNPRLSQKTKESLLQIAHQKGRRVLLDQ